MNKQLLFFFMSIEYNAYSKNKKINEVNKFCKITMKEWELC
jgi:hypothetical protein